VSVQPSADRQAQTRYDLSHDRSAEERERGDSWLAFAAVLIAIAAVLNTIGGIAAISDSKFYVHDAKYVMGSLHSWGWTVLIIGILQFLVAWGIAVRNQLARWVGVLVLALNAIAQLLMIPAYPFWSLSIFTLDVLAMYGLIVYGARLSRS
jgi:hypothetical protein